MDDSKQRAWAFEGRLLEMAGRGLLIVTAGAARVVFASARAGELLRRRTTPMLGQSLAEAFGDAVDRTALESWLGSTSPRPLRWSPTGSRHLRADRAASPGSSHCHVLVAEDDGGRDDELAFLRRAVDRLEALALAEHAAAAVAHELNNVLQSMLGLTMIRSEESPDETTRAIHQTALHAAQLGRLLLETGRPRRDASDRCDPAALLRRLEPMLDCLLLRNLWLELSETGPAAIPAPALERVILNLAANARDAIRSEGTVAFRTRRADGWVVVEVEDTGQGMDEETLRRARELAFTTKPDGTGLGLALVHRIVERYGGRLTLDSTPGRGTRVTVALPQATESGETSITTE